LEAGVSSLRRLRRISCTEKQAYKTTELADGVCRFVFRSTSERIHTYKCRFGRHFHVGHPTYRARQAMAAARGLA
jgi:hypothetical protein